MRNTRLAHRRRVVYLLGDGATMYSPQALWTAVQHRLPLTVIVMNNGCYAAMKVLAKHFGIDDPPGTDLQGLDFSALAATFGLPSGRVEKAEDLRKGLQEALSHDGPFLLEVTVAMDYEYLY